jgi:myosin heavy chain 6/7
MNMYKCTAAVMIWGNSKWKQRPREEQAEADGTEECEQVSHILGIQAPDLIKGLLKPRIKVCFENDLR